MHRVPSEFSVSQSPSRRQRWMWNVARVGMIVSLCCATGIEASAQTPSVKETLAFGPTQKDVEYEIPTAEQVPKCKVELESKGKASGWVVYGPEGQILRKFIDTNGDSFPDQWRYYLHGIEVYRDIDTNFNKKADQYRWLNLGGTRWGIDQNEDGRIDSWKQISAAEASREAIRAMTSGDDVALNALLVTKQDLTQLGVHAKLAAKILENVADAPKRARALVQKSKVLTPQTRWARFDSVMPNLIPNDEDKAGLDLQVYEDAMAIVELPGKGNTNPQFGTVQLGEMLRVGECWKLTQVPTPLEGAEATVQNPRVLMQPVVTDHAESQPPGAIAGMNDEIKKLLDELEKLDKNAPQPPALDPKADEARLTSLSKQYLASVADYNDKRSRVLLNIVGQIDNENDRVPWLKQLLDGLATAVQSGSYPDGLPKLKSLEADLRKKSPKSPLVAYAAYRRMLAEYSLDLARAENDEKRQEVQKGWLVSLQEYVRDYPQGEDTPDAMLQIAANEEFSGKAKEAGVWYQKLAKDYASTVAGAKAQGAVRRLELRGKSLVLKGAGLQGRPVNVADYQGKNVVLVIFWATWSQHAQELPELRALYQTYRAKGLEIVGVCMDQAADKEKVVQFLSQNKVTWPQIFEPGGLESPPAQQYGIITAPTMFLVGADGKVLHRGISLQELKAELPKLFNGNK